MRASSLLALTAFALAGCAKVPKNGTSDFTRILFTFTMAGPVDPNYVYAIAIRPLTTTADPTDSLQPGPVLTSGSRNGIVSGRPTRLVVYDPGFPTLYKVIKFLNPPTDDTDPDPGTESSVNPINTNGTDPTTSGFPNTLGFELTTQDLADSADAARALQSFQFDILTASKIAISTADLSRPFDALGDQTSISTASFNGARKIILTTSGLYTNTASEGGQPAAIPEGAGDVVNAPGGQFPPIDIIGYSVEVRTQS